MPQYLPFFPIQSFNSVKLIINLSPALSLHISGGAIIPNYLNSSLTAATA